MFLRVLVLIFVFSLTSCMQGRSSLSKSNNIVSGDGELADSPTTSTTSTTTTTSTTSTTTTLVVPDLEECDGSIDKICMGGYGADPDAKAVPLKVLYMGSFSNADKELAEDIINKANSEMNYKGHQLFKFEFESVETTADIGPGTVVARNSQGRPVAWSDGFMDSSHMISNYGEENKYVFILVKGMRAATGGILGYSPGLRTDWREDESIVVLDFGDADITVITHELFHGLGAPHTCDGNGSSDNTMENGYRLYKNIARRGGRDGSALVNRVNVNYDFSIFIEDNIRYQGERSVNTDKGPVVFNTATIMYQFAKPYKLFTSGDNGFSSSYSNILNSYYVDMVK